MTIEELADASVPLMAGPLAVEVAWDVQVRWNIVLDMFGMTQARHLMREELQPYFEAFSWEEPSSARTRLQDLLTRANTFAPSHLPVL